MRVCVCIYRSQSLLGFKERELKKREERTESRSNRNASSVEEQRSGSFYRETECYVRSREREISVKRRKKKIVQAGTEGAFLL